MENNIQENYTGKPIARKVASCYICSALPQLFHTFSRNLKMYPFKVAEKKNVFSNPAQLSMLKLQVFSA